MDILVTVKGLLGIADTSKDVLLNFIIDDVKQAALNYCNITEFPTELESWCVKKVIARYNASPTPADSENVAGAISSIKRGDFTVQYADNGGGGFAGASVNFSEDDIKQLNNFRIFLFE